MNELSFTYRKYSALFLGALILVGLYWSSLYSYLLFHTFVEMFSIVVACGIFALSWNCRRFMDDSFFVFLGIAYLFIGALDLVHTLAYRGMGVFPGYDGNLATQLWIAARYVNSISLFIAPWVIGRKVNSLRIFWVFFVAVFLLLGSVFSWGIFPDCFIEGKGLTLFKKVSEYIICSILGGACIFLWRRRGQFDARVWQFLVSSIILTILSELAFTFYISVYGFSNLVGHYLKVVAFYLIYKAIIETGLVKPYDLLFRNLKQSEETLRRAHDELEMRVNQRTAELRRANEALRAEINERWQAEEALRESEKKYSRLVESSLTGIYIVQDGKVVFANQRFAEIYGYSREELQGMEGLSIDHPEDRTVTEKMRAKRLIGEDVPSEYEIRGLTKDGRTIWDTRRNTLIEYRGKPAILGNVVETTQRKKMEESLQESEKALRHLSSQLMMAQENERKSIARELHDSIGQTLTAVKFSLERKLSQMGPGKAPPGISLEDILAMLQGGIEETRRIMTNLRPSMLDDLGIIVTLNWICREFQKVYPHLRLEKEVGIREDEVPEPLKIVIFRVLQEAMNNCAKHSGGDCLSIALRKTETGIELVIEDNGPGFDPGNAPRGLGMGSMKERTENSGGVFSLFSTRGSGTCVRATWVL
jgi:PAS domain S-box-containing protein